MEIQRMNDSTKKQINKQKHSQTQKKIENRKAKGLNQISRISHWDS